MAANTCKLDESELIKVLDGKILVCKGSSRQPPADLRPGRLRRNSSVGSVQAVISPRGGRASAVHGGFWRGAAHPRIGLSDNAQVQDHAAADEFELDDGGLDAPGCRAALSGH